MILAGDVGGTSTRLGLFAAEGGRVRETASAVYPSRDSGGLPAIAARFAAEHAPDGTPIEHACFGVAGPVRGGRVEAMNLPWVVEAAPLARALGVPVVWLINDLEANAYGLATLRGADLATLCPGASDASGNLAVISAGTGLGQAGLAWDGRHHHPFATEGGHADFAPVDEVQIELLRFLMKEFEHVSVERVLSGPGLHNLYRFLRDAGRAAEPAWLAAELAAGDPAAAISTAALAGRAELASRALDLFVAIYGAETGNLALRVMARGGVYLGGGIAPKILDRLRTPRFHEAFVAKGRLRPLLETVPVHVVLNDRTALLGAARCAALRAGLL